MSTSIKCIGQVCKGNTNKKIYCREATDDRRVVNLAVESLFRSILRGLHQTMLENKTGSILI